MKKSVRHDVSSVCTMDMEMSFETLSELKANAVCKELKISALSKVEIFEEKRKQGLLQIQQDDSIFLAKSSYNTSKSFDLLLKVKDAANEELAAAHRAQFAFLEQVRERAVQEALAAKAAQKHSSEERIETVIKADAFQRIKKWQEEEQKEIEEIQAFESLEKKRAALVLQLQTKKHQEQDKKIDKLIEEAGRTEQLKRDEHRLKQDLLEKIIAKQQRFRTVFTQISEMLKSFPYREEMVASVTSSVSTIKGLSEMMDTLVKQFKVGEVSQLDLTTAENLVEKLESGYLNVKNKLDDIRRQKESENQVVEVKKDIEPTPTVTTQSEPTKSTKSAAQRAGLTAFISQENISNLSRFQALIRNHLESIKPLLEDTQQKKYRFQLQMAVNTPLNAISAVSSSHLKDKLRRLQNLLRGQVVETSTSKVAASSHPLGISFCMNLLADRIVEQGEQVVSSKAESAYPIAAVALALMTEFQLFHNLLLAHFYERCPYLVPFYPPRTTYMTDQQYYKSQGYQYNADGQVETQDKYLKRMTGMMTLFFAIHTAKLPRDHVGGNPPQTLSLIWNWMASLFNLDPRPDISATVLLVCLEVSGSPMSHTYGKQFMKLFQCIFKQYYPLIKQVSPSSVSGPISRLEIYFQSCAKNAKFPIPSGTLSPHFW